MSVFGLLHWLTMRHYPHLLKMLLCVVQQSIDISCLPSPEQLLLIWAHAGQMHRPCTAYYAGSTNNSCLLCTILQM